MSIIAKYDTIQTSINKTKPFINIKNKKIICRVKNHKYYALAKRFNSREGVNEYFIIHSDNPDLPNGKSINIDMFGRYKFFIGSIWKNLDIDKDKDFNISLTHVDEDSETDVYRIDL